MKKISSILEVDALVIKCFSCSSTLNNDVLEGKIRKAFDAFCHQEIFDYPVKTGVFDSKKFSSFFKNISDINKVVININITKKRIDFSLKSSSNKNNKQTDRYIFSWAVWQQDFFTKNSKRFHKVKCNFICPDDSVDLKEFKENVFKFADHSKMAIGLELQNQNKKTIERSPFNYSINIIMKRLNKIYNQHYISHWWNKEKQEANFTIRKKTWMEEAYDREAILDWLKCFLPDFKKDIRPIDRGYHSDVTYLGSSRKLDIHVIESPKFLYAYSIRDIARTCWLNNLFVIHKKHEPWDTDGHWWRIDFWWSKNELSQNGKIKKNRHTLTNDTNTRHFFGPEKFIPYTYDISEDPNYTDLINYSAKNLDDVINRMNIKRHSKIKSNDLASIENYPVVDFCTNINPINYR